MISLFYTVAHGAACIANESACVGTVEAGPRMAIRGVFSQGVRFIVALELVVGDQVAETRGAGGGINVGLGGASVRDAAAGFLRRHILALN